MARKKRGRPPAPKPQETVLTSPHEQIRSIEPTREFVARSNTSALFGAVRSELTRLPRATDDLSRELTIETCDRMMNDPQISSAVYTLVLQALAKGLRAKPRYPKGHDFYEEAVKMYDFISYELDYCHDNMLDYLEVGMTETLEDMAVARLVYGNSVAEQTRRIQVGGPLDGKLVMASLNVKSPNVYGYVVDPKGNVPGLAVYTGETKETRPGGAVSFLPMAVTETTTQIEMPISAMGSGWEVLPISKFAVTAHRRKMNDPRGNSALRQAFNAWYLLMQIWPEFLKYLTQFASPSLVATMPERTPDRVRQSDGTLADPADILYEELVNFANGTVVVARHGTEIDTLFSQGDGTAFIQSINLLNHQMVKAILHSVLATEAPHNQTRAAQQGGKDILDIPTRGIKNGLCSMIHRQIWKRSILFNFGPLAAQYLTPIASLGDITAEDRNEAIKSWATAGFQVTPSQHVEIADILEITAPNEDELATMQEKAETEAKPPPAPAAPGGAGKPAAKPASKPASKPAKKASLAPGDMEWDELLEHAEVLEREAA